MAQTRRQHKLSESARAQSTSVTSYTMANSSGLMRLLGTNDTDDILMRKVRESSASSNDTRQRSPRLVSISLTPASRPFWLRVSDDVDQETLRGTILGPVDVVFVGQVITWPRPLAAEEGEGVARFVNLEARDMSRPPLTLERSRSSGDCVWRSCCWCD
jgi:hypothetical protein